MSARGLLAGIAVRLRSLEFFTVPARKPATTVPFMHPYSKLGDIAFWKKSVASRHMLDIRELWNPKFHLKREHKVATFGSCFAQHIGKALAAREFHWLNTEPAPYGLSPENCRRYNYDVFSCRTANIYTVSLLKQWVCWALRKNNEPDETWEKDGRIYDPFRPTIEPDGFKSAEEMRASRSATIRAFRQVIEKTDVFVFTLGLTESWVNSKHGYEYPLCPGTACGEFDPARHEFRNQRFDFIKTNLFEAFELMRGLNSRLKFILTVSPVPLAATNSGNHVLTATMESKSILRSVAGELARDVPWIDYFPSYEIINSPAFKGAFFEPDLRNVSRHGVDFVMDSFFGCLNSKYGTEPRLEQPAKSLNNRLESRDDVVCEEEMLEAFGDGAREPVRT